SRDSQSAGERTGVHDGDLRWIRRNLLDGGRLFAAVATSQASEVQLPGFEETMNRSVIAVAAGILAATSQYAAEVRHLTLTEAVHLAISQNRALKIARLKVAESQQV